MKTICGALILSVGLAAPLWAQDEDVPLPEVQEDAVPLADLFERLLRGFLAEVEPQMREMERGFSALEPEIQRFLEQMRGMTQFHPPEVLPNGDILIRRRQPDAPEAEDAPEAAPVPDGPEPDDSGASTPDAPFEL